MGYTIRIGQRVPVAHGEYCEADECSTLDQPMCYETVSDAELDDAPAWGDFTDHKNWRMPSYTAWHNLCEDADVREVWNALLIEHPGIVTLTEDHYKAIHAALARYQAAHPDAVAGFEEDAPLPGTQIIFLSDGCSGTGKDATLARLIWCDWWMRWALDNCEWPSVYNS